MPLPGHCLEAVMPTSEPVYPSLSEKTGKILTEFLRFYEDQYGVALFNSMRKNSKGLCVISSVLLLHSF